MRKLQTIISFGHPKISISTKSVIFTQLQWIWNRFASDDSNFGQFLIEAHSLYYKYMCEKCEKCVMRINVRMREHSMSSQNTFYFTSNSNINFVFE